MSDDSMGQATGSSGGSRLQQHADDLMYLTRFIATRVWVLHINPMLAAILDEQAAKEGLSAGPDVTALATTRAAR